MGLKVLSIYGKDIKTSQLNKENNKEETKIIYLLYIIHTLCKYSIKIFTVNMY